MVRSLLVANFSEPLGGGEISLIGLAEGLERHGVSFTLLLPGEGPLGEHLPRVIAPRNIIGQAWEIRKLAAGHDLIHTTGQRGLVAAWLARTGKPIIWHVRVADNDPLDPYLSRLPDLIVANSNATAERFPDNDNVTVIYNGIAEPEPASSRLLAEEGKRRIAVVARMTEEKGHLDLIPAMRTILSNTEDVEFIFVGSDQSPVGERIGAEAEEFPDRIRMLGEIKDISDHYHEFDLIVVPSRVEGFGRVAAEALLSGATVTATKAGGLLEVLDDLDELFLPTSPSEWAEHILKLLESPPYPKEKLLEHGRRFDIETHVINVIRAYSRLAGEQ